MKSFRVVFAAGSGAAIDRRSFVGSLDRGPAMHGLAGRGRLLRSGLAAPDLSGRLSRFGGSSPSLIADVARLQPEGRRPGAWRKFPPSGVLESAAA